MSESLNQAYAQAAAPNRRLSGEIRGALLEWLTEENDTGFDRERLHYSTDLWPGKCERATWYSLQATPRDPESLGTQLRFRGGRVLESTLASALGHAGLEVLTKVPVRPLRPSSWAWAPGHADLVVVNWKKLIEIRAPRANLFHRAAADPRALVKEQYRWQASAFFHELRRRRVVDRASILFLDREGANEPVEVDLDDALLVPLDQIIAEEKRKARLLSLNQPPPRIDATIHFDVLKGGRATAANPEPDRVVRATAQLNWQCRYCPFRWTCQPGADAAPLSVSTELRALVVAEAEKRWAAGEKRVSFTMKGESDMAATNGVVPSPGNEA